MDVYLVPISADRYELYCEEPEQQDEAGVEPPAGFFRRLAHRFRQMLADAERERRQGRAINADAEASPANGLMSRMKRRTMRWVAESIAQQRLLWHLRGQTEVCYFYPDDLDEARATSVLRARLGHEFGRHRFWLVIDSIGFLASGLVMLVPGPNVLAYYFGFRMVGHYLALRGAKHGLSTVAWRNEKSAPLSALRRAIGLAPGMRERHVNDVALQLRLEHLASFFERTAIPG
jgi:hypothetical protein